MIVDIYSIGPEIRKNWGPHLISFDHNFLINPSGPCARYIPEEIISEFAEFFLGEKTETLKNGLEREISLRSHLHILSSIKHNILETAKRVKENRGRVIDLYDVGSKENSHMVKTQTYLGLIQNFLDTVIKNERDIIVVSHNANPSYPKNKLSGIFKTQHCGGCSIHSAGLETVDYESKTYTGRISWSDGIENCSPTDIFIAHRVPKKARLSENQEIWIRPAEDNCLTGGYHFTLLPSFDNSMREYIRPLLTDIVEEVSK